MKVTCRQGIDHHQTLMGRVGEVLNGGRGSGRGGGGWDVGSVDNVYSCATGSRHNSWRPERRHGESPFVNQPSPTTPAGRGHSYSPLTSAAGQQIGCIGINIIALATRVVLVNYLGYFVHRINVKNTHADKQTNKRSLMDRCMQNMCGVMLCLNTLRPYIYLDN